MMAVKDKVALFIDGSNLYETTRLLRFDIDYKIFKTPFNKYGKILFANYYSAVHEDEETGEAKIKPLIDWLSYNGYTVITKEAKTYGKKIKGDMDVEITVDLLTRTDKVDVVVLISGDGDYVSAVRELQRRGVQVVVVSSLATDPPMISDALRRQADEFVEINELRDQIRR